MAFEGTQVRSTRNAATPIDGPREDLVAGDVVALSLSNLPQTPSSYEWSLIGRPEGSIVGGTGTNPWILGYGVSTSFTVDADSGDGLVDGTYVVQCMLNKGSALETRIPVFLSRATGILLPGVAGGSSRSLRKLGMFESLEDTISVPGLLAGWSTQLNRWLEFFRLHQTKGADVASATNLLLNPNVGSAKVTGTTQIDYMRVTGRKPGSRITLHFASALTLRHNIGSVPAGSAALNLPSAANLAVTANSVRNFWFDGTVVHEVGGKAG